MTQSSRETWRCTNKLAACCAEHPGCQSMKEATLLRSCPGQDVRTCRLQGRTSRAAWMSSTELEYSERIQRAQEQTRDERIWEKVSISRSKMVGRSLGLVSMISRTKNTWRPSAADQAISSQNRQTHMAFEHFIWYGRSTEQTGTLFQSGVKTQRTSRPHRHQNMHHCYL